MIFASLTLFMCIQFNPSIKGPRQMKKCEVKNFTLIKSTAPIIRNELKDKRNSGGGGDSKGRGPR